MARGARRWWFPVAALLAAVVLGGGLAAAVVELRYRRAEAASTLDLLPDEPGRKYGIEPGGRFTNEQGFNDRSFDRPRRPGVRRVVVVGDSVTFGGNVRKGAPWPSQLASLLADDGRPTDVFNLAIFGYDIEQVAATLRYRGWDLDPDLVVYAWYTNDALPTELVNLSGERPIYVGTTLLPEDALLPLWLARPLLRHSAAFRAIQGAALARKREANRRANPWMDPERQAAWFRARFD